MKKNKTLKNCSIIFLIMGVAFLIASIITFFYINEMNSISQWYGRF